MATNVIKDCEQLYKALEAAERSSSGETFYRLREGSPEWMRELIDALHGNGTHDDVTFEEINLAAGCIAEQDDPDSIDRVIDELEAEPMYHKLLRWLGENRLSNVDDYADEYGVPHPFDLGQLLQNAQQRERQDVARRLVDWIENNRDDYCDSCGDREIDPDSVGEADCAGCCGICLAQAIEDERNAESDEASS